MYKVLAFFACLALATATEVNQCADGSPLPTAVRIEGCEGPPCIFVIGTDVAVEADGTATQVLDDLEVTITATLPDGTSINVPLPDSDGCNLLTEGSCPVQPGTDITLATSVFVNPIFPPGPSELEVRLLQAGNTVVCFGGPIEIVEA